MPMIKLTNSNKSVLVSDEDECEINKLKWWLVKFHKNEYAATKISGKRVMMHRLLAGLEMYDGKIVDHINGNGLDNTRKNLRVGDLKLNGRNRSLNSNNKSGKAGVHYRADKGTAGQWVVTYQDNGKFRTKSFGCLKRGYDAAKNLALLFRRQHETENSITVREEHGINN